MKKADYYFNLKDYEDAIKCYDLILVINPKDKVAYFNKGFAYRNLN